MGLRADFTVFDLGYAEATEEMTIYIDYSYGCEVFVDTFLRVARDLVPVDTGYLKSTLDASTDGESICCETLCDYAQYVEYGTVYMSAQPYFEPAIAQAYAAARPHWADAVAIAQAEEADLLAEMEEGDSSGRGSRGMNGATAQQKEAASRSGVFGRGLGGFIGMIIGAIIVGIISGLLSIMSDATSGGGSRFGGSVYGGGDDLIGGGGITVEII
jgi:hypothetical protein